MPAKDKEDLEPVSDLNMAHRYLKYGLEFHEIISCYNEAANLRFQAEIKGLNPDLQLELEISESSFAKLDYEMLAALDRPQAPLRMSYSVNDATFFAQTTIQERRSRQLSVKVEMPMHKLQRRESLRIKVLESHQASVKLGPITLPLYDISAGGISVVVGPRDEDTYKKLQSFPRSLLKFLGQEIKVDLEVKNVLAVGKDGNSWKVGFRFLNLPPMFEQIITREAYLHSHKIWARWL